MRSLPNIRILLAALLLIIFNGLIMAQGTDSRNLMAKQKKLFLGFTVDPVQSNINYSNTSIAFDISPVNPVSLNAMLEAGYYFTPFTAITSGMGYSSFRKTYTLEEYNTSFNSTDSEEEAFEMRIVGQNIREDQVLHLLRIPLSLEGRIMFSEKFGLAVSGGMTFYFPISGSYSSSGTFSYSGYYPSYNVLLEDIPQYGFPSDLDLQLKESLEIAPMLMAIHASGGISWNISDNLSALLQAHYIRGISELSKYEASSDYHLTTSPEEINSLMEASDNNGISGYGLKISLRYWFDSP